MFSWAEVKDEFATHAPTFLSFVNGCLPSFGDKMHHDAILGFVSAVLLKARNRSLCAVQTQMSLILNQGHTSKNVYFSDKTCVL